MAQFLAVTTTDPELSIIPPGDDGFPGPTQFVVHWFRVTVNTSTTTSFIRCNIRNNADVVVLDISRPVTTGTANVHESLEVVFPVPQLFDLAPIDDTGHAIIRFQSSINSGSVLNVSCGYDLY